MNVINDIKPLIFLAAVLLGLCDLNAQSSLVITGRVLSDSTDEAVSFASVGVKGAGIGTVCNAEGYFSLSLPEKHLSDTLQVRFIGYCSMQIPVSDIRSENMTIHLKPQAYVLAEVEIARGLTAEEIMRKAVENVPNNYPVIPYALEGYYHEYLKENGKFGRFLEAQLTVYDKGYNSQSANPFVINEDFQIRSSRKSEDLIKCFPEFSKVNHLDWLFGSNCLRERWRPFNGKSLKKFNFKIDSIFQTDTAIIYKISYSLGKRYGEVLIRKGDYAIMAYKEKYSAFGNENLTFGGQDLFVQYKEFKGIMYLDYMSQTKSIIWKNEEKDTICDLYFMTEYVTTSIHPDTLYEKQTLLMDKNKDLYIQNYTDKNWNAGNTLPPTQLQQQVQRELNERK